jgi:RNA polymerase sigma factor (sigma-70 family)
MTPPHHGLLLPRALAGDAAAWSSLVEAFSPLLLRTARGVGLSHEDAEDVGQSVWAELVKNGDRIRNPAQLPGWLVTTTRWKALQLRRRATPGLLPYEDELPADTPGVEELLAEEQELQRVRAAVDQLPERCRTLLTALFEVDRPSYEDIAARLELPVGSIGPTRARCLARLHRILHREEARARRILEEGTPRSRRRVIP